MARMRPQPGITKRAEIPVGEPLEAEFIDCRPIFAKEDCDSDGNPNEGAFPYQANFLFRLTDPRHEDAIGELASGRYWINRKPAREYERACKAVGVSGEDLEDWDPADYRGAQVVIVCSHREGKGRDGQPRLYTEVREVTARG